MLPGNNLTEQANLLYKWGFDGIALFMNYCQWNEELYEEVLNLRENTGIIPCEFVFTDEIYGHLMSDNIDLRKKSREMYKRAAEISGEIGAATELEFAYGTQNPLPLFHPYKKMTETEKQEFLEMYKEVTEPLMGSTGKMLLEGINRYESPYLNSIKECTDIIDTLDRENTGVLADFFHMSIEESNIAESIKYAGDAIKHVHLGDNNRLLPGYGTIDWQAGFNALKEVGYNGFLNLECSTCGEPSKTLPETAIFLKKMLN
ncbi:sugar phosphate isomerase/epimerase [Photorhabdus aegyptia]|uniref:Sugar phosphate isomerase/epimerase n=2 Tax=Photorhabdus aegyptia TaxID=2805098 RepID=A0A022PKE9_9GAMM|nr:sugar phosphate isomerase/epimerase [Photorhabdus aegyptia]